MWAVAFRALDNLSLLLFDSISCMITVFHTSNEDSALHISWPSAVAKYWTKMES